MSGKRYFNSSTGDVEFQDPLGEAEDVTSRLYRDGTYRTVFGPAVAHNGQILANSVENIKGGVRRMLNVRDAKRADGGKKFKDDQIIFVDKQGDMLKKMCDSYTPHFEEYTSAYEEAIMHHDDAHAKRQLRIDAWSDLISSGRVHGTDWFRHDKEPITYKLKKNEIAKIEKWMRAIGDLGVAASLFGFRITKYLKEAMAENSIDEDWGKLEFIPKPSPDRLDRLFREHLEPTKPIFSFFSDDSILSFFHNGEWYSYNIDISSCDASHGPKLFEALIAITPEKARDDMRILIDQCRRNFKITNPTKGRRKESITFKCKEPRLFSGWTGTTIINNLACILFGSHIVKHLDSFDGTEQWLKDRAAEAGYTITATRNQDMYDMQFLKHSPVVDDDENVRALINLGVFLRSSGTCKGDLPGRGDLRKRAEEFQAALLQGMYPRVSNDLIDRFKTTAGNTINRKTYTKIVREDLAYKLDYSELLTDEELDTIVTRGTELRVSTEEIVKRYRLTGHEILELEQLSSLGYGWHTAQSFADKVLNKDYELNTMIINMY